jgi:hypothetical protein
MRSVNIGDARTVSAKRTRVVLHTINVAAVTFIFITLAHRISNYFGIDPDLPAKHQDQFTNLIALSTMLVVLILFYCLF